MSGVPLETCSINFGIINSITKLHLVVISTESYYDARIHEYQIGNMLFNDFASFQVYSRMESVIDDGIIMRFCYHDTKREGPKLSK